MNFCFPDKPMRRMRRAAATLGLVALSACTSALKEGDKP